MSQRKTSWMARVAADQRGQVFVVFALSSVVLIGMVGFVIDFGRVLYARAVLQASSDAAAAAAAADMTGNGTIPASATSFSSLAAQKNFRTNLTGVTMASGYPQLKCLTSAGLPACPSSVTYNAITVRQQVTVPMYFATVLGFSNMVVTATSTAGMRGGAMPPLDIALVMDTTGSMNGTCGSGTRLSCAKDGVRTLLSVLWPCADNLPNCGAITNGNVANPIDKVGLLVFPGLKSSTPLSREFDCAQNLTSADTRPYQSATGAYEIVALSSDYRTSTTSSLNGGVSNLVKAVTGQDGNNCGSAFYGLENPGGQGSYFAHVINEAQSMVVNTGRPMVQNVIIFVSDGDANTYPSAPANPCQMAVAAAQAAAAAGTWVYSIAYGASSSSSTCANDSSSITAYSTMQQIASSPSKFFNVPSSGQLTSTFQKIGIDLTNTRIVSDDTP